MTETIEQREDEAAEFTDELSDHALDRNATLICGGCSSPIREALSEGPNNGDEERHGREDRFAGIAETELNDELADEALDRPAMVAGSAGTNHCGPSLGPLSGRCASAGTKP
jgi:hypothetical protein